MKKFTKLFLSCALVSVVAAATASMAMAEDLKPAKTDGLNGTYDAGVLTITKPSDLDANKQATLLVVEGTEYSNADAVVGIDQAAGANFDKTGLKGAPDGTDDKSYTVMLGYYTTGDDSTFKIAKATLFGSAADTVYVKLGDADGDGNIKPADAILTLKKANKLDARGVDVKFAANKITPAGETEEVWLCNVDDDADIKPADAILVLKKGNKLDARGVDVKRAGATVEVEEADWMPETMKVTADAE